MLPLPCGWRCGALPQLVGCPTGGASSQVPASSLPPSCSGSWTQRWARKSFCPSPPPPPPFPQLPSPALVQTPKTFSEHRELLHPRKACIDDRSKPHWDILIPQVNDLHVHFFSIYTYAYVYIYVYMHIYVFKLRSHWFIMLNKFQVYNIAVWHCIHHSVSTIRSLVSIHHLTIDLLTPFPHLPSLHSPSPPGLPPISCLPLWVCFVVAVFSYST